MTNKFDSFFNRDFYPTPDSVLDLMAINFRGEIVLEPSAGKGNIIDYAKSHGAKDVLFCEINKDLAHICQPKARFMGHDFLDLKKEEISHVTLIVMNPPFSEAAKHIVHAYNIAPEGCQIVSLCNSDMLHNSRYDRSPLHSIVKECGVEIDLEDCFATGAERTTDVKITCLKLYKPIYNESTGFEGFYLDEEPEYRNDSNGVIKFNEVQSLVNSYIGALKCFDEFQAINSKMKSLCTPVGMDEGFSYELSYGKKTANKTEFAKELQRRSWLHIFGKMKLNKYLTSGVLAELNRFTETQSKIPFTVKNVYRMLEIIVGTAGHNFEKALVEAVDNFTRHTHENRYNVEGWKTNSGHMLNKKIIVNWVFETGWGHGGRLTCKHSSNGSHIEDLVKVLCNLTGRNYDDCRNIGELCRQADGLEPNRWYSNGFFEVKGFKKGTCHLKFQDEKTWELLNRKYAEIKGHDLFEGKKTGSEDNQKAFDFAA